MENKLVDKEPLSLLHTGAIAVYKGAVRCRVLEVKTSVLTGRVKSALVNFGGGVPFMRVSPGDLEILPGETRISPDRR